MLYTIPFRKLKERPRDMTIGDLAVFLEQYINLQFPKNKLQWVIDEQSKDELVSRFEVIRKQEKIGRSMETVYPNLEGSRKVNEKLIKINNC